MPTFDPELHRPKTAVMITAAMMTTLVAIVLARMAYGLILPVMRVDLGLSHQQAGNLGTITALGYLLFVLPGGVVAARWGGRRAVLGGLALITLGFVGLVLAHGYGLIATLMLLLGVGTAFCFAPMLSLIATWYPLQRGLMIGWMTTGIGVGLALTGVLVPPLMEWSGAEGWRAVWAVFAGLALVACLLVLLGVRDPPVFRHADGSTLASSDKWLVYRNPRVIMVGLVYCVMGAVHIVLMLFMVSYMLASGLSSTMAGGLFAMSGLLSVLSGPLWGWLSDAWGRGNALVLAMVVVLVAICLPLLAQTLPAFFLHALIMGCGAQGTFTMIQASSTDQVAPRHIPIAVSYVTLFFAGGQFIGPALGGWLIDLGGYPWALAGAAAAMMLGIGLSWRVRSFSAQPAPT